MASCGRLKASLQDNMKTIQRFQPLTTAEPVAATRNNLGATIPRRLKKQKHPHPGVFHTVPTIQRSEQEPTISAEVPCIHRLFAIIG